MEKKNHNPGNPANNKEEHSAQQADIFSLSSGDEAAEESSIKGPPESVKRSEGNAGGSQRNNGIRICFKHEEDLAFLAHLDNSSRGSQSDLFLHRQALSLSQSPGFDTLLSPSLVRDIKPLDYQLSTVEHVLKNLRGRALLCDEVGLGKTIEAGLIMMEYILRGLVRRVLILTPPSLVEQWLEEMYYKLNLDFVAHDHPEFKAQDNPWEHFPRIIASLDTAKREKHKNKVLAAEYDLVIIDEVHHLRNKRTLAYQLAEQLKKKYMLLLTATPVENSLEELFNLVTLLMPGQLETSRSFRRNYIKRGQPLQPKNTEKLKKLVQEVMVRNRRSETGAIRSIRHAELIDIELTPEEMDFYRNLTSFIRRSYRDAGGRQNGKINQFTLKTLQREVGSSIEAVVPTLSKMSSRENYPPEVVDTLENLIGQALEIPRRAKAETLLRLLSGLGEKVVVFTVFKETQRFLAELLRREGMQIAELHGGMRRQEKEEQIKHFAREASVLVSTETGSEGRNLQFARAMINYDLPWNPMRIEQRIGRIHRLEQHKDVYIYNISAADTVESHILNLLDAKINMFQLVIGELDMILGNLKEKKDFEDLVMEIWARSQNDSEINKEMNNLGEQLVVAKQHYEKVKKLDNQLLGELFPDE